jgi:hypothetical protein
MNLACIFCHIRLLLLSDSRVRVHHCTDNECRPRNEFADFARGDRCVSMLHNRVPCVRLFNSRPQITRLKSYTKNWMFKRLFQRAMKMRKVTLKFGTSGESLLERASFSRGMRGIRGKAAGNGRVGMNQRASGECGWRPMRGGRRPCRRVFRPPRDRQQ